MTILEAEYIVVDCETTGLDRVNDELLQVAWMLLDKEMQPLSPMAHPMAQGQAFVGTRLPMREWTALPFHQGTGFVQHYVGEAEAGRLVDPAALDAHLCSFVRPKIAYVGNQVEGFDRRFFERQLPGFWQLGYSCVNVSAVRAVYAAARGVSSSRIKEGFGFNHDAWGDVVACYKELQFYKGLLKEK